MNYPSSIIPHMRSKPTLFLMTGLPGSGKTTEAIRLEQELPAIRFSSDELLIKNFGNNIPPEKRESARDTTEDLAWNEAQTLLMNGSNVILDFGFWSKKDRDNKRDVATRIGATTKIIFLDAALDVLWERASSRSETATVGVLHFTRDDLEKWSKIFQRPTEEELNY